MAVKTRGAVRRVTGVAAPDKAPVSVGVDGEERRHLIESCAFFRAERFRHCQPGRYRRQDIQAAAADIDAAIRAARKKKKKR
jgi:hypothetical protein